MKNKLLLGVILAVVLLSACQQQRPVLRIGIIKPSIDHFPLSYALDKGLMDRGKYQTIAFSSGWEVQEALIAGKIDLAILPFTFVWNAAAKGYPVKTISFWERETDAVITHAEISEVQQLQGKKVGLLKGSTLDILWQDYAARESLRCETVYFRTPNEIVAALQSRDISAAVLYVPLIDKLTEDFPVLHWFGDRYPGHPCCDLAVNTTQITGRKGALVKQFYLDLQAVLRELDVRDLKVEKYLRETYGLSDSQMHEALQHTGFRMGLETGGKMFQREMTKISLTADYIDMIPSDEDVYLDLFAP